MSLDESGNLAVAGIVSADAGVVADTVDGISVNNHYAHMGSTVSGAMAIFGHNIKTDSSSGNTVLSANTGYHSSMIKMYYDQGITFHSTSGTQTAGNTFYDMAGTTNELMRISNSGKVGIGTTSPDTLLHISLGSTAVTGGGEAGITMTNKYDNPDNSWSITPQRQGLSNTGLTIYDETDSRADMTFDGSGKVGIGTPTPDYNLEVEFAAGNHTTGFAITNSQAGGYGSALNFVSERSDNSAHTIAARIRTEGGDSWNTDASTDSSLKSPTSSANTVARRVRN